MPTARMPWQTELSLSDDKPLSADESARTIALGDRIVPYVLKRSSRRTIGLTIDHRGLRVGAPNRATLGEIEALIRRNDQWVGEKLDEWRHRRRPEPLRIVDGSRLPFLGTSLLIRLAVGTGRAFWNEQGDPVLTLFLRAPGDAARVLEKALRERARRLFAERLAHYGARLGLVVPPLALSDARTRWGSCSTLSGIRLNWRLIHFPLETLDYVVVHELAHLREMNHSRRFWAVVETACPDYPRLRDSLKSAADYCPVWR